VATVVDPVSGQAIALFNPRQQKWAKHFSWANDGAYILGLTACGRATVNALQMNNTTAVTVRRSWVSVGWHPPEED
jgi:hypothetical protein